MVKQIILVGAVCMMLLPLFGCGPSEEERKALIRLNEFEPIVERGGQIKQFERFEMRPDRVFMIEAEILDQEGRPIGRLRSERVEGFGTTRPRIQWYETPGVSEEWRLPPPGRRRGQGRQGQGGQGQPRQQQQQEDPPL